MSTLLMAGHKLYGPEETNFQHFWSWNVSARNPFYPFRQQLMEVGKKVHAANMDVYEVAVLAALLFMASDFSDLAYPEAIEEGHRKLIAALKSYELTKVLNVKSRLSELFALVPEIRHLGMWHQELMKQTRINVQIQEVNQIFDTVHFRES
ncbi:hypothetical protein DPMN_099884 [Dreissena polymorpha]|uniref:NR LBD domain-containing protein n=3 Tax=Dreissena polymorpha TaxID=45954 RepID=A0A9D4R7N2_DREPO|nr:hypothetical protein DPMN_099884 [Dreissena polymorpha]